MFKSMFITYTSKCLVSPELNYLPLNKLVLALIITSRKLRHYFDAHSIKVLTSSLIKTVLRKADLLGRKEKWSVELGRFHIKYEPRTTIKGQIIANFIDEFIGNAEVKPDNALFAPTGGQDIEMAEADQQVENPQQAK